MKADTIVMYDALIVAGGKGQRVGLDYNKVLYKIKGKMILDYAVHPFFIDARCSTIIIVSSEEDFKMLKKHFSASKFLVVLGGNTRQESVYNGLKAVKSDYVLIHDGARAYLTLNMIDNVLNGLRYFNSVSCGVEVVDTLKRVEEGLSVGDVKREALFHIQTPQGFLSDTVMRAHDKLKHQYMSLTCDASIVETMLDIPTKIVPGDKRNIKFTTQQDAQLLEMILND